MHFLFILSLLGFAFLLTTFVLHELLPKFYFKKRVKMFLSKTTQEKEEQQSKGKDKTTKRRLRVLLSKIEKHIQAANLPMTALEFATLLFWGNLISLITVYLLPIHIFLFILIGFNIGVYFILKFLQKRREKQMVEQLPDVLQLISSALKAGYSFVQTVELVSKENIQPLSKEFHQLYQALHFGEPLETALANFKDRLNIEEISNMVDTILITRESGGNVTIVIDNLLETMRENERLLGSLKSITAQGKMSAWVIGCLPTGLFLVLYLLSRDYMSLLFSHPVGITLTIIAIILQVMGILILNSMVKLKVR